MTLNTALEPTSAQTETLQIPNTMREVQVDSDDTRRRPKVVARLNDWQYVERSIQRLICGWGRGFTEWNDIVKCHEHVYQQSECVRRLRERLQEFPGSVNNLEAPVSGQLERLCNTVLEAPSFEDAVDGIYSLLLGALTRSYAIYSQVTHPVHDAPTTAMLHQIVTTKETMRLWHHEYRRRRPHVTDAAYKARVLRNLAACDDLLKAIPVSDDDVAQSAGVRSNFRVPPRPADIAGSRPVPGIMPYLKADFASSVETRRLFWAFAYMREMHLAIDQLRWIYDGYYMPWEWTHDVSRHLWDESRHGNSGYSRLLDFGITISEIGFEPYDGKIEETTLEPMTREQLYRTVYSIGLVAETGHFVVKREAYDDFKAGGDMESAEMMLFDIIDETAHVQYAHRWLPLLAEHAGVDCSGYKEQAVRERDQIQRDRDENDKKFAEEEADQSSDAYRLYQELLERMRKIQPLTNAATCPKRSPLPM